MINLEFKKVVTSLLASFSLPKKQKKNSEAATLINHLQNMSSDTDIFEEFCMKFPEHFFFLNTFQGLLFGIIL